MAAALCAGRKAAIAVMPQLKPGTCRQAAFLDLAEVNGAHGNDAMADVISENRKAAKNRRLSQVITGTAEEKVIVLKSAS